MATVTCSACGKENEPTGNWNYCRGCGGRLAAPVREKVLAGGGESADEKVTVSSSRTTTRDSAPARVPMARAAPARKSVKAQPKSKQELLQELRPWTYGLIFGLGTIGMIVGSLMKEQGMQYGLLNDPFYIGMIGGFMTGGLIAQCMLWYRQSQQ